MAQLFLGIIGASFALGGLLVVAVMMIQDIRKYIRK
jgi:hypothetical protein